MMKKWRLIPVLFLSVFLVSCGCAADAPTDTPAPTVNAEPTASPVPEATPTTGIGESPDPLDTPSASPEVLTASPAPDQPLPTETARPASPTPKATEPTASVTNTPKATEMPQPTASYAPGSDVEIESEIIF